MSFRLLWRILLLAVVVVASEAIEWRRGNCKTWTTERCICSGSSNGRSTTETWNKDRNARLQQLRRQYINCTVVYGSLELTHIDVETNNVTGQVDFASVDLSFLQHIEEITGYLLIYSNAIESIALPALKVVWGDESFEGAGVQIMNNANLKYVSMPSFRSLQTGTFNVSGNPRLCHFQDRIEYSEILGREFRTRLNIEDPPADGKFLPNFHFCDSEPLTNCSDSCKGNCWGPGEEECQIIYRSICPARCDSGMCFKDKNGETKCCDRSCAGGCHGEGKRACTACAAFLQDGECVDQCNGLTKYDRIKGITVEHDKKRYTYDRYCVEKCPEETLIQADHCVVHCRAGFNHDSEKNTRECEKCDGVCPKKCTLSEPLDSRWFRDPANRNCTVIDGYVQIFTHVFERHTDNENKEVAPLTAEDLATLQSVKVITEFLYVSAGINSPNDLGFLRNLEVIEGRRLFNQRHAVVIASNMNLRELQLQHLRRVRKGDLLISGNTWLCYADSINYLHVLKINGSMKIAENNDPELCAKQGRVCAKSCNQTLGCWGDGPSMCVECEKFKKNGECVSACPSKGFFKNETSKECLACHEECETCSEPGDRSCGRCRHVSIKQGEQTQCVAECPKSHYRSNDICKPCDESCYENGCTGPGSFAGADGCKLCKYAYKLDNVSAEFQCIMAKNSPQEVCQDNNLTNYYLGGGSPLVDQYVCERCNSECLSCRQFGDFVEKSECKCRNYEMRSNVATEKTRCVSDCGPGSMIVVNRTEEKAGICQKCHQFCDQKKSCTGPFESDCEACEFGIYDAAGALKCLSECPPELPYPDEGLCKEVDPIHEEQKRLYMMSVWIGVILVLTIIGCGILGYYAKKNRRLYKQELEMNPPSIPPQDPYDPAVPNMNRLTIIPGENLHRFPKELGRGAFGVVYKGYLYPKGKHSGKVPVAIKNLKTQKHDGSAEKEMLEEAGLMASMNHKHLLKIAGICLVDGVSLVTPYRIYGCLLDFLRKHQKNVYAKDLLLYCYQICDAMEYLHLHKMVHRDLAARNVLVKRPNYVEVTDFGLAKMLKKGEDSVEVKGSVAPKWLAIECFEKQIFNEKTDVWAFGVTIWEILTKGCIPFQNKQFKAIHEFLLDGSRLEIPNNVSQPLYNVMLRCWLINPSARPSFSELKKNFENFCRQPNSYLMDASQKNAVQSASDMQRIIESYNDSFVIGESSDDEPIIDPLLYDPMLSDDSPQGSPASVSKPLLPRSERRLPSSDTTRYHSEPRGWSTPNSSFKERREIGMDDGNYMIPSSQNHNVNPANLYTPVIVDESGRRELSRAYYNELPAKFAAERTIYENEFAPVDEFHRYQNEEIESVSNPSYVSDPVQQKETVL